MSQGTAAGNLTNFGQLKYPSDLSEEHFFPEAIRFGFVQRKGVDFKEVTKAIKAEYMNELKSSMRSAQMAASANAEALIPFASPADKERYDNA